MGDIVPLIINAIMKKFLMILFGLLTLSLANVTGSEQKEIVGGQEVMAEAYISHNYTFGSDTFDAYLLNKPTGSDFVWHIDGDGWEIPYQDDERAMFLYTSSAEHTQPAWIWVEYKDANGVTQRILCQIM